MLDSEGITGKTLKIRVLSWLTEISENHEAQISAIYSKQLHLWVSSTTCLSFFILISITGTTISKIVLDDNCTFLLRKKIVFPVSVMSTSGPESRFVFVFETYANKSHATFHTFGTFAKYSGGRIYLNLVLNCRHCYICKFGTQIGAFS